MTHTYTHTFSIALQPFYLYLWETYDFIESLNYDGTTLSIETADSTTNEEIEALDLDVSKYVNAQLDISEFVTRYNSEKCASFKAVISQKLVSFHQYMSSNYSDWFEGVGSGKGFFHVFCSRTLSLAEEITLYSTINDFINDVLDLSVLELSIAIRNGINIRKIKGTEYVEDKYSTVMLMVAQNTTSEAISNVVENTFHPAIVHLQNGLFISSYNAVNAVVPTAITSDPTLQAMLESLKASYLADILQMCYDYYAAEVLVNTPSIPPQTP